MSWGNPFAWLGLVALGIPLVLHLLSRQHARVENFPSLRFIGESRLTPARQRRLSDVPLLLLRLAMLAAAVIALTQPMRRSSAAGVGARGPVGSRAVIVDTSASMRAMLLNARAAIDSARTLATRMADSAAVSTVLATDDPAHAVDGAAAWLATQPTPRELVIISDFQLGAIDAAALAQVPADVGIRLMRVAGAARDSVIEASDTIGSTLATTRTVLSLRATSVEWRTRPVRDDVGASSAGTASADTAMSLLVAFDAPSGDAVGRAMEAAGVRASRTPTSHSVMLAFGSAASVSAGSIQPIRDLWMLRLINMLRADSTLTALATREDAIDAMPSPALALFRDAAGRATVSAAMDSLQGQRRMVLFSHVDVTSTAVAALIESAARAIRTPSEWSERETQRLSVEDLRQLSRSAQLTPTTQDAPEAPQSSELDAKDNVGRWLWIIVLLLLLSEWWLRRGTPAPADTATVSRA